MLGVRQVAWALLAGSVLSAASSLAGEGSASFQIQVTLHASGVTGTAGAVNGSGGSRSRSAICTSQSEGDASQALIQVLCTVGPFVTISPMPGQVFAMQASEASRTAVGPGSPMAVALAASAGIDPRATVGTLTALQVSNATGNSSALEMLVSF